jgi:hypothetical protein
VFLEYHKEGYLDTLLQPFSTPLSADIDLGNKPLLGQKPNIEPTAARFGTAYDPTRAYADVWPLDCNGQLATRKTTVTWLDRDERTVSVPYFHYSGGATAVNLPINAAGVTRVTETNQIIGTANVLVRPRAVSLWVLAPAP